MEELRHGYTVLIADDDPNVHKSLSAYFRNVQCVVLHAENGEETLRMVRENHPDIVLLDIMMPRMDGISVLREIRRDSYIPVILLSARAEEFDKLLGLEAGADDYITKPFSPREVLARVTAVMRRLYEMKHIGQRTMLMVGNLSVDLTEWTVRVNGEVVPCTFKEVEIIWTMASNPGMVFSREHLLERVWGYDFNGDARAVDSHIKRIRAKLTRPENDWEIKTVWGVGYRFDRKDA